MSLPTVGFIGLGIMGKSMARNLMKAGYAVHGFSRTKAKCADVIAEGLAWHDTPADLARAAEVIVTMVGYPADVEQVYLGDGGLVDNARPGAVLIDMTTSRPTLAQRIAEAAAARGVRVLDAPVSGGDVGARDGTLSIFVGGDEAAFAAVEPVFAAMGKTVVHLGPSGAGQHGKMVNQIVVAGTMLGVTEGLTYARKAGLSLDQILDLVGGGAARSFLWSNLGRRMIDGDFAPGFFVHHFIKDMTIALEEAERMGISLDGLALTKREYETLADRGGREDGTQALFKVYNEDLQ